MKAFKKQFGEQPPSECELVSQTWFNRQEGWKAALEWVLNNDDAYCCGDVNDNGEWEDCPTKIEIQKELEE